MASTLNPIAELAKIAGQLTGNQFGERHWNMIQARLQKRLTELGLKSYEEYLDYFQSHRESESPKLIGLLTTHHTYFFREFTHFEYLQNTVLPAMVNELKSRPNRTLRIWCAASSRGQEPYSLAMFLDLHLKKLDPSLNFEILGTDVDQESVAIAKNGVYLRNELKEAPLSLVGDHWIRGTGDIADYVKAKESLRKHCSFQVFNLLDLEAKNIPFGKFDLIFCRNVFIYFNQDQIRLISTQFLKSLNPNGHLFLGISESISALKLPFKNVGPSIYQPLTAPEPAKAGATASTAKSTSPATAPSKAIEKPATPAAPKIIRVLCVDDSSSILALLKKILSKEAGFEVVGTAENGEEAIQKVKELKPDALTLDIHMPKMTGIEYLKANFKSGHPPVVMVTSVSRDDAALAGQALESGASDFVEKPALSNLQERGDEIKTKLRCAVEAQVMSLKVNKTLDRSFQTKREITNPDDKLRILVMSISQKAKLKSLFSELTGTQPPCVLFIDGAKEALPKIAEILSKESGKKIQFSDTIPQKLEAGQYYLLDLGSHAQAVAAQFGKNRKTSILVLGEVAKASAEKILSFQGANLIIEDLGEGRGTSTLMDVTNEIVAVTSFPYLSIEFLAGPDTQSDKKRGKAA